eukprot:scaffold14477_cov130-Isochrysis_galbana.AAC.2
MIPYHEQHRGCAPPRVGPGGEQEAGRTAVPPAFAHGERDHHHHHACTCRPSACGPWHRGSRSRRTCGQPVAARRPCPHAPGDGVHSPGVGSHPAVWPRSSVGRVFL